MYNSSRILPNINRKVSIQFQIVCLCVYLTNLCSKIMKICNKNLIETSQYELQSFQYI